MQFELIPATIKGGVVKPKRQGVVGQNIIYLVKDEKGEEHLIIQLRASDSKYYLEEQLAGKMVEIVEGEIVKIE